jgi:methyl-accepting chemotaxis protein-1 (serine sensor receptor)
MKSLTVGQRLALLIGSLVLLMLTVGLLGLWGTQRTEQSLRTVYEDRVVPLSQLQQIQHQQAVADAKLLRALADEAPELQDQARKAVAESQRLGGELWKAYMATFLTPEEAVLARKFSAERESLLDEGVSPALALLAAGDRQAAAAQLNGTMRRLSDAADATLQALVALQVNVAAQEFNAAEERFQKLVYVSVTVLVLASLMGIGLGWQLTRSLRRQLGAEPQQAQAVAQAVAQGDLTRPVPLREGDRDSLMAALATMRSKLLDTVTAVRDRADGVATAATEIAQGNLDLSQRTEEQASALQQTAASMEQLGTSVQQNAENARQASQLAVKATETAQQGVHVVGQVVESMRGIEDSSRRVVEIIGVIDGIAFQTNILALNSAVEAARAGEQGRGFAVVAGEVRALAQRSAAAAQQVKQLIQSSVEQVQQGGGHVNAAGTAMQEVVRSIRQVNDLVADISAATSEQSGAVVQIGQAVTQMDQVTQQNAALVEESAAAAESLRLQSGELLAAVSVFRVDAGNPITVPVPKWEGIERRSPQRARNVVRPAFGKQTQAHANAALRPKTGTDGDWASF